jgi:hypothetical protein
MIGGSYRKVGGKAVLQGESAHELAEKAAQGWPCFGDLREIAGRCGLAEVAGGECVRGR